MSTIHSNLGAYLVTMKLSTLGIISLFAIAACGGPEGLEDAAVPVDGEDRFDTSDDAMAPDEASVSSEVLAAFRFLRPRARVCKHSGMRAPCAYFWTSDVDLSNNNWSDGSRMNDSITSVHVYTGHEITLCRSSRYRGTCKHLRQSTPGYYWNMVSLGFNDMISSLEIRPNTPIWSNASYRSNYPHDRQNGWSNEAQGVTHDANNWYISNKWHIQKYPVGTSVSSNSWTRRNNRPGGCNHFGDLSFYGGDIFAPLEGCPNGEERIYVYDTNLSVRRYGRLAAQTHASWVGINPVNGLMYSSDFRTNTLEVYSQHFSNGSWLHPLYSVTLDRSLNGIQGGVFSDNGYLYLTTSGGQAGVHVFDVRGASATRVRFIGPNGYKPGFPNYEEVEGITLWNLDNGRAPGISGQIHWLLLDNDSNDDDIYFKHIRVNNPSRL